MSSVMLMRHVQVKVSEIRRSDESLDHAKDVFLGHDEERLAVDLDLGAAVLAEEDLVADLDVQRNELAVVVEQRQVVHLGERLVRVRIVRGALHSGPTADPEIKNNM